MPTLIITNGDIAAELLATRAGEATVVRWRDVLHEGPIVGGPLEQCSATRIAFLAERFGIGVAEIASEFHVRDTILRDHARFETVQLWFEHDLYDQLQLLQILSFFADEGRSDGVLLVQADDYLGQQDAETILRFADRARYIGEDDLDLADRLWADLAMPTPEALARRLDDGTDALPFAGPALHRFLEELPSLHRGLGRTEETALSLLTGEPASAIDLFRKSIAAEEAAFMGDLSYFRMLRDLADADTPLIAGLEGAAEDETDPDARFARPLSLTEAGRAVIAGEADHVRLNGVDRWWAGTRLKGRTTWRYDRETMNLISPQASAA